MDNYLIVYVCGCEHTSQADSHNCGWLEHHAVTGYVCPGCDQAVRAVNITALKKILNVKTKRINELSRVRDDLLVKIRTLEAGHE